MRALRPRSLVLIAILAGGLWAALALGLGPASIDVSPGAWRVLGEFFGAALHPALASESGSGVQLIPKALDGIVTTLVFAAAAMSLALVVGLVLGLLASSAWWSCDRRGRTIAPLIYGAARTLIALMRSVHELLWALLFLSAFGLKEINAVIAIAIPYGGTLAKVFSEMLDEAPRDAADAICAAGGTRTQAFAFGLLPRALPDMSAYAFYRFECALRSSAILGFFGYPTLGYYISLSFENLYYREVWTYLYALFALVALFDWWSGALRRRLTVA
jgi:phosphonate transport system permease protein